jgi:hypothetical protein
LRLTEATAGSDGPGVDRDDGAIEEVRNENLKGHEIGRGDEASWDDGKLTKSSSKIWIFHSTLC